MSEYVPTNKLVRDYGLRAECEDAVSQMLRECLPAGIYRDCTVVVRYALVADKVEISIRSTRSQRYWSVAIDCPLHQQPEPLTPATIAWLCLWL